MYKNVGKKIMVLAQVLGWLFLAAGAIAWIYFLTNGYTRGYYGHYVYSTWDDFIGWIALVVGLLTWVSTWPLYGFGQMVDDVHTLRNGADTSDPAVDEDELPEL